MEFKQLKRPMSPWACSCFSREKGVVDRWRSVEVIPDEGQVKCWQAKLLYKMGDHLGIFTIPQQGEATEGCAAEWSLNWETNPRLLLAVNWNRPIKSKQFDQNLFLNLSQVIEPCSNQHITYCYATFCGVLLLICIFKSNWIANENFGISIVFSIRK